MLRSFVFSFFLLWGNDLLAEQAPLKIVIEPNNIFLERLMPHLLAEAGLEADILTLPSQRALEELNRGGIDANGMRLRVLEELYPNVIRMDDPIINIDFLAITNKDDVIVKNWQDLARYRVAYPAGWKIFDINVPSEAKVITTKTQEQLFRLLEINRVDVVLLSRPIADLLKETTPVDNLRYLAPALHKTPAYLFFHKSKADIAERFTQALRRLKENDTYLDIYDSLYAD